MNIISGWKKGILIFGTAGLLAAAGAGGITAWAVPSSGVSASDNVVVRDRAEGSPAGSLTKGQAVTIEETGQASDGHEWYRITYTVNGQEKTGWVRSDLIDTSAGGDAGADTAADTQGSFQVGEKTYRVAAQLPSAGLPEGFAEQKITYMGQEIPAAKLQNGELFLLFLENAADAGEKGFFVYDTERDSVIPLVSVEQGDGFVIITNIPQEASAGISPGYAQVQCPFEEGAIMAYQLSQADAYIDSDAAITDFYYVYGMSDNGVGGWYVYDAANHTLQRNFINMRYTEPVAKEPTQEEQPGEEEPAAFAMDSETRMVVGGLGLIGLLLLVLTIIFGVRNRRLHKLLTEKYEEGELESLLDPKKAGDDGSEETSDGSGEPSTIGVELPGGVVDVLNLNLDEEPEDGDLPEKEVAEEQTADIRAVPEESPVEETEEDAEEPEFYDDPDDEEVF